MRQARTVGLPLTRRRSQVRGLQRPREGGGRGIEACSATPESQVTDTIVPEAAQLGVTDGVLADLDFSASVA